MEPDEPISITLTAAEWNVVIDALMDRPYRVAAPLVRTIGMQAKGEHPAAPEMPRPNGEIAAHAPD
jgi:hypothetical protein